MVSTPNQVEDFSMRGWYSHVYKLFQAVRGLRLLPT